MSRRLLIVTLLGALLLLPSASTSDNTQRFDLSTYPYPFIQNKTIVGFVGVGPEATTLDHNGALDVIVTLRYSEYYTLRGDRKGVPEREPLPYKFNRILIIDENFYLVNKSGIIVGGPCTVKAAAALLNTSTEWPKCAEKFPPGKGIIEAFQINDSTYLLVAGYSEKDTIKAARVLGDYLIYNLSGQKIEVNGEYPNLSVKTIPSTSTNEETQRFDLNMYPYPFITKNIVVTLIGSGNNSASTDAISAGMIFGRLWFNYLTTYENDAKSPRVSFDDETGLDVTHYPSFLTSADLERNEPVIIVGGPCANEAAAKLMNRTMDWPNCAVGFEKGKGLIELFEINEVPYLLVAGYQQEDTHKAAYVMSHYLAFSLNGTKLEVIGTNQQFTVRKNFDVKRIK